MTIATIKSFCKQHRKPLLCVMGVLVLFWGCSWARKAVDRHYLHKAQTQYEVQIKEADQLRLKAEKLQGQLNESQVVQKQATERAQKAEQRLVYLQKHPLVKPTSDQPECQDQLDALYEESQARESELLQVVAVEKEAREATEHSLTLALQTNEVLTAENKTLRGANTALKEVVDRQAVALEKAERSARTWKLTTCVLLVADGVRGAIKIRW